MRIYLTHLYIMLEGLIEFFSKLKVVSNVLCQLEIIFISGPQDQKNQVSSFIDASLVYGNMEQLSQSLQTFQGGQLKMIQTIDSQTLLPISTKLMMCATQKKKTHKGVIVYVRYV